MPQHVSVAFCSPAKSLPFSGLMENPLVGKSSSPNIQEKCTKDVCVCVSILSGAENPGPGPPVPWRSLRFSARPAARGQAPRNSYLPNLPTVVFLVPWGANDPDGLGNEPVLGIPIERKPCG